MSHNISGRKFDRPTAHRTAMYRNLVMNLMDSEKIVTTEAKAKEIRNMAEKMITLGKKGDLSARRRALAFIYNESVVEKVFNDISKRYAERNGGYTRITKLAPRLGDGAPMAQLELVK
jgi:large subunit ribosomal protein L17